MDEAFVREMQDELLKQHFALYRRIMNHIHENGNIFYDAGRLEAYKIIAVTASNLRKEVEAKRAAEQT